MEAIKQTFAKCKAEKRSALVTYVTAGYPTVDETVDILLGLENGGAGTQLKSIEKKKQKPNQSYFSSRHN